MNMRLWIFLLIFTVTCFPSIHAETPPALQNLISTLQTGDEPSVRQAIAQVKELQPLPKEALPVLASASKSSNKNIRSDALQVLKGHPAEATEGLIALLEDEKYSDRPGAADVLKSIGPEAKKAIPTLAKLLSSRDRSLRASAAVTLGQLRPESKVAAAVLIELLKDPSEELRSDSALALALLGEDGAEAVPALTAALQDPSDEVRINAARALWSKGSRINEAVLALSKNTNHKNVEVALNSAVGLGKAGQTEKANQIILKALNDKKTDTRLKALEAFGQMGPAAQPVIHFIKPLLKDPEPDIREQALMALAKVGEHSPDVIHAMIRAREEGRVGNLRWIFKVMGVSGWPVLFNALKTSEGWLRIELEEAFNDDSPEAVGFFENILKEKDPVFRQWAVGKLRLLGEKHDAAVTSLLAAYDDPDFYVHSAAADGIRRLGEKAQAAVPDLIRRLKSNDLVKQVEAVSLLESIGAKASGSVPALQKAVSDADPSLSYRAAVALKAVHGSSVGGIINQFAANRFNARPGRVFFLDQVKLSSGAQRPVVSIAVKDFFEAYDREYARVESPAMQLSSLAQVRIDNGLKSGDRLWFWMLDQRHEFACDTMELPAGEVGPFTKLRLPLRQAGPGSSSVSLPEKIFLLSRVPFPAAQTWKVRPSGETENSFAFERAEKRLGEIMRSPDFQRREKMDRSASLPLWTSLTCKIMETEKHGQFLVLQFDTNENPQFAHYHVMVFQKEGEKEWRQVAGFDSQGAKPLADVDGDGVPELHGSTELHSAVLWKVFPTLEVLATRSSSL